MMCGAVLFAALGDDDYFVSSLYSEAQAGKVPHNAVAPGVSIGGRAAYLNDPDQTGDQGRWFGGVNARIHLIDTFAVEGQWVWHHYEAGGGTLDIYPLQISGLVYVIPYSQFAPYLLGGFGWYTTTIKSFPGFPSDTRTEFGWHLGFGLDIQLSKTLSISGDYRYTWLQRQGASIPLLAGAHLYAITFGVNFHLGEL